VFRDNGLMVPIIIGCENECGKRGGGRVMERTFGFGSRRL